MKTIHYIQLAIVYKYINVVYVVIEYIASIWKYNTSYVSNCAVNKQFKKIRYRSYFILWFMQVRNFIAMLCAQYLDVRPFIFAWGIIMSKSIRRYEFWQKLGLYYCLEYNVDKQVDLYIQICDNTRVIVWQIVTLTSM